MWKTPARMALVLAILPASAPAQDTRQVLDEVSRVMGTSGLNAITWSGVAAEGNFGQSRTISFGLASTSIANYTVTIDFARAAARMTGVTTPPPVRGAAPPPRGTLDRAISPDAPWSEQFQIWVTPWGFLRGAAAQGATLKNQKIDGVPYTVVTWVPAQRAPSGQAYRVVGYINADKLVERVETWVDHPIFGDMHVETRYRDYRNAGGLLVPARVTQRCVGMETFVAAINTVRVNPPDLGQLLPPAAIAAPSSAPAAPVGARSEKLADGVYRITGSYAALAVEFQYRNPHSWVHVVAQSSAGRRVRPFLPEIAD